MISEVKETKSQNKKQRKTHSIRFHIFLGVAALSVSLILVLWVFHAIFLDVAFKSARESDIKRASSLISENIDSKDIASLIDQVSNEYELCLGVVMVKGYQILYQNHVLNNCIICTLDESSTHLLASWHSEAIANDGEYTVVLPREQFRNFDSDEELTITDDEEISEDCLICVRTVIGKAGNEILIILNADIEPMSATMNAVRIVLALVTIGFCTFAVLISFFLTKNLSKPIEKITKGAAELRSGDYNVRFEADGPVEIQELAKTLNTMTAELERADTIQKELIANISHDLRTPLTMITGYSEFMRDFPSEITPENMQVIIDEASRLNSLVNDLLLVSKLQSGTQAFDIKKICLTKVISDTVNRYDTLLTHKEYKISFIYDREIYVMADETRLLQVVYNLVNNAINYTGDDKSVTIRQDVLDDIVRVSIIDTGEGISEENLPLVWDRYYKIDKVHKRAITGTGLGLSIVKNILMVHNSRFGVSSEVGRGSTFWFEFKIHPHNSPSQALDTALLNNE